MAIRMLRLKSGEDVVADIDENQEYIMLENPAQVVPMGDPKGGNIQMGFGPWVPFNKGKTVEIPRDWVVFIIEPADDIVDTLVSICVTLSRILLLASSRVEPNPCMSVCSTSSSLEAVVNTSFRVTTCRDSPAMSCPSTSVAPDPCDCVPWEKATM